MELRLKYNEHVTHPLSAAFIRGNTPDQWLREMNAWNIPLQQLACFIISQNNNPLDAAGLFVVFNAHMPAVIDVRHPYTVVGGKLFIPVDAELMPAVSEKELKSMLIWDCQVFHPSIGFIGFERSDRIEPADLLQNIEPVSTGWHYAHPGLEPWTPLHQVSVRQLTAAEVFDSIKEHISNKSLEEIPKANKEEVPSWLNNPVAEGLLKATLLLISGLSSLIPAGSPGMTGGSAGSGNNSGAANDRSGFLSRLSKWINQKIEDLEKQRASELKRLTDLFDKDSDEALQYAIPLSSPYLNRGNAATPSAHLTKRSTNFNLGNLGGGRAVDGWNVDNYYDDLRSKYLKAAQNAIEKGDYKKAAYVYAHLLGDYTHAATTLRQGKHYREAAVLYKDHLNNLSMAAACYEEGGLLTEAIELYTGLNQHEKAGDLYMQLNRKEPAVACYEKCVHAVATNKDYLEMSRIVTDKIGDKPRAKNILLTGWKDVKQPEACLLKYFDLVADDNQERLYEEVKAIYAEHVVASKELSYLNVIDKVNQQYSSPEMEDTCRQIAYEVVSEQVQAGNAASLHNLRNFVPGDQLLTPDCYRFIHTFKQAPEQKPDAHSIQLIKEVVWKKAFTYMNQLLVVGVKPTGLVLARINIDGHVEYYSWVADMDVNKPFVIMGDPDHSNKILLYADGVAFNDKHLPANKYFKNELFVFCPTFLPAGISGINMQEKIITTLFQENGETFLNNYSLTGELKRSLRCVFKYNKDQQLTAGLREMVYGEFDSDEFVFMLNGNSMWRIYLGAQIDFIYSNTLASIRKAAVNIRTDGLLTIAYATDDNVYFETYDAKGNTELFIGKNINAADLKALPNSRFVVADKRKVQVYDLSDHLSPEMYCQFEAANNVAVVFEGIIRDQIGILDTHGQVTLHSIAR